MKMQLLQPFVDFGNSVGYYRGNHHGSISSSSSLFPPTTSSLLPPSPFLSSAFPVSYLGTSYPRANTVAGFGGATIGIGPGKYSAYRKSETDPKLKKKKKFKSELTGGKAKIALKLSKSDPELKVFESKPQASKTPSLYEALRNRAKMGTKSVPKTAALSRSGEVIGNNGLDEFPVRFHPEEELARKG